MNISLFLKKKINNERPKADSIEYYIEVIQILSTVLLNERGKMKEEFVKNKAVENALMEVEYQWIKAYLHPDSDYLKKLIESWKKIFN